ncbi:ARSENITE METHYLTRANSFERASE [Salix purpurea]|uniref:ARSENITE METHYLTRANSFERASE n=1 Tax=Salix purpurea TaxID=77065 RepID=A0A9Q0TX14_SALPP|nr:ARSENITE METHYLTRANSFERASE [Salix purpurea]
MAPSRLEAWARLFVTRYLGSNISTDRLILEEEGGETFTFEGTSKKCNLEAVLKVHNPQFYWKVMTRADMGLADAYIDGDFSFADKDQGLLDLFMVLVANRDANKSISEVSKKRGWWTPSLFVVGIASAKFFLQHVLRQNTLTQARRNISRHYDLSNEFFSLFLRETMAYSTAIFKTEDEDLNTAQLRKISALIEKDNIRLLLCDYRELPKGYKYDRIVSCEMIEHVGHEYMEDYFSICESALAEDGLLVLQFISIPDERYDEYRRSSDFIKEYIFPSLSRITSAMSVASRLSVEHVENLGSHYYFTLRCWRKNFLENKRKILSLGFDEKFIRTWEYYFDYCAAGFKTYTLGDYQVVFSRPGNVVALGNPYKGFPSAYQHLSLI